MAHGVVVLGMHRSGTSAASRIVNLLGVPLPAETDLLPNAFDNPRGHWESRSLVAFNDRVLEALGCDWTCPPHLEPGWELQPALAALRAQAAGTFHRLVRTPQWVWKDPRNTLLLRFWTAALASEPVVLLVLRSPHEIAASLERRDLLERSYALALWERYLRGCLAAIEGLRVGVTTYDGLLADPRRWCEEVRSFLHAGGIECEAAPPEEVAAFVEPSLRHFAIPDGEAATVLSPSQRDLAAALETLVGFHDAFAAPALARETQSTEELLAERRDAVRADRASLAASAS